MTNLPWHFADADLEVSHKGICAKLVSEQKEIFTTINNSVKTSGIRSPIIGNNSSNANMLTTRLRQQVRYCDCQVYMILIRLIGLLIVKRDWNSNGERIFK